MEKGTLVEFRVNGERRLAVLDRPEGKKNWVVIDDRGQSSTLHPRAFSYTVMGQSYEATDIPQFLRQAQGFLDPSSLELAWELLVESGDSTTPADLAGLLFSEQTPPACYAAFCLLDDDRLYFKQKGERYEPRPTGQVADLKHQLETTQKRQQEWQAFIERLQTVLGGEAVEWQAADRPRLDALEKFALFADEAPQRGGAIEILTALGRAGTAEAAFEVLVQLGLWKPHENLFLRRNQIPTTFSHQVLDVAQQYLASPPPDLHDRLDLTHLKVYTIDDESTCEIDDGLSLENLPDGRQRIWIHIADPTRWILPGDTLDLEARRRATTIYLPTGMIPMFPSELATGPMSLNQGKICCALSFGVILTAAGEVDEVCVHTSHITITYRLTYEDVDEMLELGVQAELELLDLARWARCRQTWRQSQGAIRINMPEAAIKVINDGEAVDIHLLDGSFARELVAEMMILAGAVAAQYSQMHNLPILFRTQPQPELPSEEELLQLPAGPVRACAIRRCMPKSEVSLTPLRHASLGLESYAQVTSPIRRYGDLLAHFQIKAHLRGEALPFSDHQVQEIVLGLTNTVQEATLVERQTNRYWVLEFLRRNAEESWSALMLRWLREHENLGLVLLEDLGVELVMRFDRPISPGDQLSLKVAHVDPRQDVIHLRELVQVAS
jgi:exoribonuclease-2